jgi:hypothetical protein
MNKFSFSTTRKEFLAKIIAVDFGLLLLAAILALFIKLPFSLIFFSLGLVSTTIGGYLGSPGSYDSNKIRVRDINFFKHPSPAELIDEQLHSAKNMVPIHSFENAFLYAGIVAIVLGLIILF